jgi:hypothetical protein
MECPTEFIGFITAILVNANAVVRLNGRRTGSIDISRSIQQGCPISQLLFILELKPPNCMPRKAIEGGTLHGVRFEKVGIEVAQQFYSHNTSIIVRADRQNAQECEMIFNRFGQASGLKINWEEIAAVLISDDPVPNNLAEFKWKWEWLY